MGSVPPTVREQVLRALDPEGKSQRIIELARSLPAGGPLEFQQAAREFEHNLTLVERCWLPLTDRGWGVANVGLPILQEAGRLLEMGDDATVDEVMAGWFDAQWNGRTIDRVGVLTDGTPGGHTLFSERARLLRQAWQHHERGGYAASVMMVLAQVEGITAQVTSPPEGGPGKLFFSKRKNRKADVVDDSDLASILSSLDRLRDVYSADVPVSQADGSLSRHGILHGQELAFDTRVNSLKCWSLLDVLVQWALPRGHERALRVDTVRGSIHAGSDERDSRGRRLDDRQFKVTRNALYEVCSHQSAYAVRHKRFDASATDSLVTDQAMAQRGLTSPHGVTTHTGRDGKCFWAQRQTVSGWWLARGLTLNAIGLVSVWYYTGPNAPSAGPSDQPGQWGGQPDIAPPDWQGGDD